MSTPPPKAFRFRLDFPPALPISARAEELTAAIQAHPVLIVAGETGSGKTTQIPKMCLAAGRGTRGRIACTQPRRVAALSISRRVAEELNVAWGREVGCKIRFNDQTTPATIIKFLTDGMLLAEVQGDPLLREYDTLIIDEAHERSLNIDFLLGHLRTLRFKRPELRIIITSATIDTAAFSAAFDGAPVILVEGRTFPVEVIYAPLDQLGRDYSDNDENEEKADLSAVASAKAEALHYIDGAVEAVERILHESDRGDVLVFLPSERDIRETRDLLEGRLSSVAEPSAAAKPKADKPASRRLGGGWREGRQSGIEVVPLFGRLTNAEQQRVFAPTQRRKVVLATNIAETSLTIPGIRFVIDSGLARVSRYSPQARTRRLPIEPVSQSSAEQRRGRSGRMAEGVCIRLFSEKDFLERPRFTQPEIQRANLADVILRLKAFGLGDIERFPFINMPATRAVRAGYALLEELGALERAGEVRGQKSEVSGKASGEAEQKANGEVGKKSLTSDLCPLTSALTAIGHELARLPVDPTVGRMILQARTEKALREVLVIAAGLSIQDPRERPLDRQQQADAAHRRFAHPDSDFLTLLNIWDAFHDEFATMTQAKLRRFCREHFLSFTRLREWRDIHEQLLGTLKERDDFRMTAALSGLKEIDAKSTAFGTPPYRAIHRSVLAGLLGNLAHLDEESGGYKATHDRRVVLFPGSVLFRGDKLGPRSREGGTASESSGRGRPRSQETKTPRWIVASEVMETTRLYARTCARIDPQWALELGAHLVRTSHSEPFWNEEKGRVLVKQRTRLYGLELETRAVSYGQIDPTHATEIFIREGLVNDTITFPLDFLAHNRAVREKLEDLLTRARDSGYLNLDEAAYRFYAERLMRIDGAGVPSPRRSASNKSRGEDTPAPPTGPIGSVGELVDLMRGRRLTEPRFLFMAPEDLRDPETIAHDAEAYPTALPIENRALPLNYAYKPGQSDDGVTLEVSVREAEALTPAALDWAVPGHLAAKVEHYLRALPKEVRRGFVPLGETAKSLSAQLESRHRLTVGRESSRTPNGLTPCRSQPPNTERPDPMPGGGMGSGRSMLELPEALAAQILEQFRISIDPAVWVDKSPPDHLRVRVRVLDAAGRELAASRRLDEIRAALVQQSREASAAVARDDPPAWRAARAKWETPEHTTWSFDSLPERVLVSEQAGAPVYAFPGLQVGRAGVARRLFKTPEEASQATRRGIAASLERSLGHDLMWTERDLRALRELGPLTTTLAPLEDLQAQALESIRRWVTDPDRVDRARPLVFGLQAPTRHPIPGAPQPRRTRPGGPDAVQNEPARSEIGPYLGAEAFAAAVERAKSDLRGLVPRFVDLLREILTLRQELLVLPEPPAGMPQDLAALIPADFLRATPYLQLAHFPRYLQAMKLRAGRARRNPGKDAERAAQVARYRDAAARLRGREGAEALRWLAEEFRVSLFAQELGTAEPVSAVKLDRALAALERSGGGATESTQAIGGTKPIVSAPVSDTKTAPLKNLNALGQLFQR